MESSSLTNSPSPSLDLNDLMGIAEDLLQQDKQDETVAHKIIQVRDQIGAWCEIETHVGITELNGADYDRAQAMIERLYRLLA